MREREGRVGVEKGQTCELFLYRIVVFVCVLVTKQRQTLIQCSAKRTEGSRKEEGGWGGCYWKMNGLEDKCMQARAGRPPLYTAPLP